MKGKFFKRILCMGSAAALLTAVLPTASVTAVDAEKKVIALTFDDGPNTTTTNEILDLMEKYNAKASFFLIGDNINEESAKTVLRAKSLGCEINNHSKTHPNMGGMSAAEIKAEVGYTDEKVFEITGEHTKFFRPPFIDTSPTMYENIDVPFICGEDIRDYMDDRTAEIRAENIMDTARDGIIYLLHDAAGNSQTVEALKIVMPKLIEEGYEFVTLTELFERQGETPIEDMMYSVVPKYPCKNYVEYKNIFKGEAVGEASWSGWHETAILDGELLKELGDSYAVQVEYSCEYEPVIAFQKWSGGASIWQPVHPFYYNGRKACFLPSDLQKACDELGIELTDLDRMTVTPYGGKMTITSVDILVKGENGDNSGNLTDPVMGDVNCDGKFSVADLVTLHNILLGKTEKPADSKAGDLCADGRLDTYDLVVMRRELLS